MQELREKRVGAARRKDKALQQQAYTASRATASGNRSVSSWGVQHGATQDPLMGVDPWASGARGSKDVSPPGLGSDKGRKPAPWNAQQGPKSQDPRVDALISRMNTIESRQGDIEQKVNHIDGTVEKLGVDNLI